MLCSESPPVLPLAPSQACSRSPWNRVGLGLQEPSLLTGLKSPIVSGCVLALPRLCSEGGMRESGVQPAGDGSLLPAVLPSSFLPRPGDRIMLVDDSNEDWWKVT